ncbi:GNAT family N-acetyltransferase [Marinomonas sp. PE14-40]|uniref:GNAT family N-acetyltransferase n=1 Tax=Marinomonas sp. PE14-40 TaxID=3060621 RepID=UPI003F6778C0
MILIDTPRLQMREFTLADKEAVLDFASCEKVTRYTGYAGMVKSLDDAAMVIRDIWMVEYQRYGYGRYALIHKEDQKVIGFCGVKFDKGLNAPDIGYRLLPQYWGQGLATEAVTSALKYAREVLDLDKIIAVAVDENVASNKILHKLGFNKIDSYIDEGFRLYRYESLSS